MISINPARGDLRPKKAADQSTLKTNWAPNKIKAFLTFWSFISIFQIINNEIPIIMKSTVHTGKNTQFGGANEGLASVSNHTGIEGAVKIDPRKPANRQIVMLIINFVESEDLYVVIYISLMI